MYSTFLWRNGNHHPPSDLASEVSVQLPRLSSKLEKWTQLPKVTWPLKTQCSWLHCVPRFCEKMGTTTPSDLASEVRMQLPRQQGHCRRMLVFQVSVEKYKMMQLTRPLKSECSCLDCILSFCGEMQTTVPSDLAFEDRM